MVISIIRIIFFSGTHHTRLLICSLAESLSSLVADQRNRCDETAEPTLSKKAHSPKVGLGADIAFL